jgi:hypothetical protein
LAASQPSTAAIKIPESLWRGICVEGTKCSGVVKATSSGGSTPMWKSVLDEAREVVWLASIVGGLSAAGLSIAIALAAG